MPAALGRRFQRLLAKRCCLLGWQVIKIGTVGGSDLVKQMEQLGSDGEHN